MISGSFASTCPFASCGSTATYVGMPSVEDTVRSKRPMSTVARYVAIGSASCHTHVVSPFAVAFERRTPFAIAVRPSGTLTVKS